MNRVPYLDLGAANAEVGDELDEALARVVASGRFVLGPEVEAFEDEFARYSDSTHCVGVGCGFDAIVIALRTLGIGEGDEVIVPTNTYVATWLAVSAVGARPVGAEPDDSTFNIDPARLDECYSMRTKAVLPVHLYGQPAEMGAIVAWARRRGVAVVADAAHAHGSRIGATGIGGVGDAVAWSFYPGKNLGALGDAGGITTNDAGLAARARLLRNYGSPTRGVNLTKGVNSRLDELQAAVLRVRLAHLDEWNERRRANAARYLSELGDLAVRLPTIGSAALPVWHVFALRVRNRDSVVGALTRDGVETLVHYPIPPFLQPAYAELGVAPGRYPIAERHAAQELSLPIGPHLTPHDQALVIKALRGAVVTAAPDEAVPVSGNDRGGLT